MSFQILIFGVTCDTMVIFEQQGKLLMKMTGDAISIDDLDVDNLLEALIKIRMGTFERLTVSFAGARVVPFNLEDVKKAVKVLQVIAKNNRKSEVEKLSPSLRRMSEMSAHNVQNTITRTFKWNDQMCEFGVFKTKDGYYAFIGYPNVSQIVCHHTNGHEFIEALKNLQPVNFGGAILDLKIFVMSPDSKANLIETITNDSIRIITLNARVDLAMAFN